MAIKTLLLRSKLEAKQKELSDLRSKDADFQKREAELEAAIGEMNEETLEGDRKVVEDRAAEFEKDQAEHANQVAKLEADIADIENQIKTEESKAPKSEEPEPQEEKIERMEVKGRTMKNRTKFFGMSIQERDAFFRDEKVKGFLANVRMAISEKRALNNVGLTIPEQMLDLVRENITEHSKLLSRVRLRKVKGKGRQNIMGTVPEAVWTEMCAALNELDLNFNNTEVDGYTVSGFFAVCRATLEDSDMDLTEEIISALGQAIGRALDKAIIYGTGTKMPLGVVTRLAQTTKPSDYPATSRAWKQLNTTNLLKTDKKGVDLYKAIVTGSSVADNEYAIGDEIWIMNKKTHKALIAEGLSINAAGAIISGMQGTMPAIGGDVIELSFIPDGDIIFGYFDLYLLAERSGMRVEQSDDVRFLEDQRAFKGIARYDGKPVIAESFGAININNEVVTTSVTFAADKANTPQGE